MSDVRVAANRFARGIMRAPGRWGTARVLRATIRSGMAASLNNGRVHIVREAAIVTDGSRSRLAVRWMCGGNSAKARPADVSEVACDWCERIQHLPDGPVVYRLIDEDGALLYIGSTLNLGNRLRAHSSQTPWWPEVATIEAERHATEDAARYAESIAISSELPPRNQAGKPLRVIKGGAA